MSDNISEQELTALESALRGLAPAAATFDRDQLFFRAGQEAARPRRWAWPLTSVAFALLAATLGTILALRPGPQTIERTIYVNVPAKETAPVAAQQKPDPHVQPDSPRSAPTLEPSGNYLRVREQVLRWGIESLPEVSFPGMKLPERPAAVFDLYEWQPSKS